MPEIHNANDEESQTSSAFRTVLEKIHEWSSERSAWQQDALRRILQRSTIEDSDIAELTAILKAEKSGQPGAISAIPLSKGELPANPEADEAVSLKGLSNIAHVNKLAADQVLEFAENGITVIYGDNGAGKSGYTRILKSACRARHRDKILTDVFSPEFKNETPSADIAFETTTRSGETVQWEDSDQPDGTLSAVSVFDRECATVHIKKKNEIAFRPYGLDIPDTLADVCRRIEDGLKAEKTTLEASQNALFLNPPWQRTTTAGAFIGAIAKDTQPAALDAEVQFSEEDETRLKFLTEKLSKDLGKAAAEERLKAERLERFKNGLTKIPQILSQEKLSAILVKGEQAKHSRQAAELAAASIVDGGVLPNVGGEVWKRMWTAAKEYSTTSAYPDAVFPNTGEDSRCVLCQQPLEDDAKTKMQAFERHVSGGLERQAQAEKAAYDALFNPTRFENVRFSDHKEIMEDIQLSDPALLKVVRRYLASIRLRQITFERSIQQVPGQRLSEYAPVPLEALDQQIVAHNEAAQELLQSANDAGVARLNAEKVELEDRKVAVTHKAAILEEIKRLQEIDFLDQCIKETSTRKITTLGNNIADDVITPNIRDRFEQEIIGFVGNRVRVEMNRSGGRFGSPHYKVGFFSDPNADISDVLSEGEQTCVAMAVFLAELSTAAHKSALVFDDPVSSLDHKWRHKVARRLAEESRDRQVIVFTHDLIFLNDIEDSAESLGANFTSRHLIRYPEMVGIVNDSLPWDGMKIKARIDALEKDALRLRNTRSETSDEQYKLQARDLYSNMRASWERALEEVGLSHVVMRHRDEIKAGNGNIQKLSALDADACDAWYSEYSKCCDYVSAHDSSRGRNQEMPEPGEVIQDVEALNAWVRDLRTAQNSVRNN